MPVIRRILTRLFSKPPQPIVCPSTRQVHKDLIRRRADVHAALFASLGGTVAK